MPWTLCGRKASRIYGYTEKVTSSVFILTAISENLVPSRCLGSYPHRCTRRVGSQEDPGQLLVLYIYTKQSSRVLPTELPSSIVYLSS